MIMKKTMFENKKIKTYPAKIYNANNIKTIIATYYQIKQTLNQEK